MKSDYSHIEPRPFWIIGLWLSAIATAFWWFEFRHWEQYPNETVLFERESLGIVYDALSAAPGRPLIVHFVQSECPCHRYQMTHIERLTTILHQADHREIGPQHSIPSHIRIPASPSVAVWDASGKIVYFGPYSSGAFCGRGKDYVSLVFEALALRRTFNLTNIVAIGCYCEWHASSHNQYDNPEHNNGA